MIIIPSFGMEFLSSVLFFISTCDFSFFFLIPVLQIYADGATGVVISQWNEAKTAASAN